MKAAREGGRRGDDLRGQRSRGKSRQHGSGRGGAIRGERRFLNTSTLVIGATGHVGGHVLDQLAARGEEPFALSRRPQPADKRVRWATGDLADPESLAGSLDAGNVICTASIALLARSLPVVFRTPPSRLVAFSSTGVLTKLNSADAVEHGQIHALAEAEQRLIEVCQSLQISWTILRPTLIYEEGRDANVTRIASTIRRLGFFPLYGRARGLRQPVHAEDLAKGAISACQSIGARNRIYEVAGGDTIPYREMVGRIFDGMKRPRLAVPIPPALWKTGFRFARRFFPRTNIEMGVRMSKDMNFDCSAAERDFGWQSRPFRPEFRA